jgi:hypothetical protein
MNVPAKDEERDRLDAIKNQLDGERRKFTEAAIRLGRDKAALEVRASSDRLAMTDTLYRRSDSSFWPRRDLGKSTRCSQISLRHPSLHLPLPARKPRKQELRHVKSRLASPLQVKVAERLRRRHEFQGDLQGLLYHRLVR